MRDPTRPRTCSASCEARRRRPRAVGHRLDLVRHAAGSDPGDAHVPDRGVVPGESTATRSSPGDQGRDLRARTRPRSTTSSRSPGRCELKPVRGREDPRHAADRRARTGRRQRAEAARMIAAHQAGYLQ